LLNNKIFLLDTYWLALSHDPTRHGENIEV